ncbi:galactose-binding domain-like protein [Phellopilus nigrolimitatus]|nr:galactose-binding domain-like protein [Phellopilus nigrolimitatus]
MTMPTDATTALKPLVDKLSRIKVSSSLDRSAGKKHLTDGSPETCWTSQQGLPQFIQITFDRPVVPRVVHITFQGGFVGKRCALGVVPAANSEEKNEGEIPALAKMSHLTVIYPEDVNRKQTFELPETSPVAQLKMLFEESSDFFGRITIYDLQVAGLPSGP